MRFDELVSIVAASAREDWEAVGPWASPHMVYREDVRIAVEWAGGEPVEGVDWALLFDDKRAFRYEASLLYNGAVVRRVALIGVDGGRAFLPATMEFRRVDQHGIRDRISEPVPIPRINYRLAALVNSFAGRSDFDRYFERVGLTVRD